MSTKKQKKRQCDKSAQKMPQFSVAKNVILPYQKALHNILVHIRKVGMEQAAVLMCISLSGI